MTTLLHQVWIDAPVSRVYAAISTAEAIGSWWDEHKEKHVGQDLVWEHCPAPSNGKASVGLKVVERDENRRVVLECIYAPTDGTAAADWIGTVLTFELHDRKDCMPANAGWMTQIPGQTILDFKHAGWADNAKYAAFCNSAWGIVLSSLGSLCESKR